MVLYLSSLAFNLLYLSDNPIENEILIHHSFISCKDIIINKKKHNIWLKMLRLFFKIKQGFFFSHLIQHRSKRRNSSRSSKNSIINFKTITSSSSLSHLSHLIEIHNNSNSNNSNNKKNKNNLITKNDQLWICTMISNKQEI